MPMACISGAHDDFRKHIRARLITHVCAHADQWETLGFIPRIGWQELGAAGLLEHELDGDGFLRSAIFLEELGRTGYAGIRAAIGVHAFMAAFYLRFFGTRSQQERWFPGLQDGSMIVALAISEEDAGSELRNLKTQAAAVPGNLYLASGQKTYVANGTHADLFVTLARTADSDAVQGLGGTSLLAIKGASAGITRQRQEMLGWRSADTCRIGLDNVQVAADQLIGRPGRGLVNLMRGLDFERMVAGLLAMGGAGLTLDLLTAFAREHRVGDSTLSARQAVRHRTADLLAEFDLVRQYGYHAAWLHSQNRLDTRTASILKLRATELASEAARLLVQYQGAQGYLSDSAAARHYRDAMAGTIAAGASELMRENIFETSTANAFASSASVLS